jgi:hypothetical protein
LEFFAKLGAEIGRLWRERHYDERAFPEISARALEAAAPSEHVDFADAVRWALSNKLPPQPDIAAEFGEPPLTLYFGEGFYIDLLFWLDGTTSIHQHGFSGAFHVLAGSSVHSRYRFTPERRINSRLAFGELSLIGAELLTRGQTRPILAGDQMSHALFHLDRPSVTLVVRTMSEPDAQPQFSLRRPGIALDPFYKPPALLRRLQCLRMMNRIEHPSRDALAALLIEGADIETIIRALDAQHAELGSGERFDALLEVARPRLGDLYAPVAASYEEMNRLANITSRRRLIKDPDHRFFLALLLNLPGREMILDFIRRRYDAEPIGVVMGIVEALSQTKPEGYDGPNAIDIELDESSLAVLRYLVEGRSQEEIAAKLAEEYEGVAEQADELKELCDAFRESLFFRTLLA